MNYQAQQKDFSFRNDDTVHDAQRARMLAFMTIH